MRENEPRPGRAELTLGDVYADRVESEDLEDRVVADLVARGRLRPAPTSRRWHGGIARAAAAALFFAAGWGASALGLGGTAAPPDSIIGPSGGSFMFLLWEGPGFGAGASPVSLREEYSSWALVQIESGMRLTGAELGPGRVTIPPTTGATLLRGEAILSGYFIVEAEDAAAARRLAEAHPHLAHGGWVEVVPLLTG